jgi:ABC-2 type transport system permease protein
LLLAAAATLIHVISPGKYTGMVLFLLFVIYTRAAGSVGLEHPLWQFGSAPAVDYSDMDGFGPNATPFAWLMLHWSLIAAFLLTIAAMVWRGVGGRLDERVRRLSRVTPAQRTVAAIALLLATASGSWIFYNTNVVNDYRSSEQWKDWRVEYEKSYRRLTQLPQPSVSSVEMNLDFFPEERRFHVAAKEQLVNLTAKPIQTIWLAVRRDASNVKLSLNGGKLVERDARFGMYRFELDLPLAPGATTQFAYDLESARHGFEAGEQDDPVLHNGTFLIGFRLFPTFGYRAGYE